MLDVLITGGTVIDGAGAPGFRADVGIKGEEIEVIGDLSQAGARRVIDATGHIVAPGFVDSHAHSEAALLVDPQHAEGLRQGITTEILGQDGLSYAPLSSENYRVYSRYIGGILGTPPAGLDMSSVASFRSHYHKKTAINTAYAVAHGALRLETVGFRDEPMDGDKLKTAKQLLEESMEQGAVGLATGLSYYPQAWSDTEEIVALCKTVHEADGVYIAHVRDVNTDRAFGGGMIPEALEIGRRSGVKVHFSHHRTAEHNAGQVAERMALIDEAKAEGVDCSAELYPYPTGSALALMFVGGSAHEGGPDALIERLEDPRERERIVRSFGSVPRRLLDDTVLSYLPNTAHMEGMRLSTIAAQRRVSREEVLCDLLIENDLQVGFWVSPPDDVAVWRQISRDCLELLSRPDYMVGSDSIHIGACPHPRAYGAFPRLLGRLRRQFGVLTLEQMVQRMTDNPARRFGLTRRGRIERGYYADIVVFDADHIMDNATYDDPRQYPTGIPFVLVNGEVAVDHERCTGVLAGQAVP